MKTKRFLCGVMLVGSVLVAGVSCSKKLPEEEIYGTWERKDVEVKVILKQKDPTLMGIASMVEDALRDVMGNMLVSMTCEANNALRLKVVDPSTKEEVEVSGTYYYRENDQFKLEAKVKDDIMLSGLAVLYGGLVGMQYTPKLEGDSLELRLAPGVAAALMRILLSDKVLPYILEIGADRLPKGVTPKVVLAMRPFINVFVDNVEEVAVTVSLQRAQ